MSLPFQESVAAKLSDDIISEFIRIREQTIAICAPIETEDHVVQPASFVSPPKWHLAHTTWFFANFCLNAHDQNYQWPDEHYPSLFNSYYKSQSKHWVQGDRGVLSRPTVAQVYQFRAEVDAAMLAWLGSYNGDIPDEIANIVELGLQHEQQHQELLLMDIKYILWSNPSWPAYQRACTSPSTSQTKDLTESSSNPHQTWQPYSGGLLKFGQPTDSNRFCFDNETPQHQVHVGPFKLSSARVSNGAYLEFINDGGYRNPLLWLSEGWDFVQRAEIDSPLYWKHTDENWCEYSLNGQHDLVMQNSVKHISFHEAYAFARWSGKRLPTEFELELYNNEWSASDSSHCLEATLTNHNESVPSESLGGLWEWTSSPYTPYPGYAASMDALGEYNGKFMINQMVLRGSCLATPKHHSRPSYRNFYHPEQRWCFAGMRLAEDA